MSLSEFRMVQSYSFDNIANKLHGVDNSHLYVFLEAKDEVESYQNKQQSIKLSTSQPITYSTQQPINQQNNQTTNHIAKELKYLLVNNKPANQPTTYLTNQSISQPIRQPITQANNQLIS